MVEKEVLHQMQYLLWKWKVVYLKEKVIQECIASYSVKKKCGQIKNII